MMETKITAPVVFCFFNREDRALRVFERIKAARPERLCLVSDGPRPSKAGEADRVAALRRKIESLIDWTDKVDFDYAPENMGCGPRLSSGIGKVLSKYDRAIILEDDCVPALSFFEYEQHLLDLYEKDPTVGCVSGTYFLKQKRTRKPYGFTHFPQIWGWGTWARAWEGYEYDLSKWSDGFLYDIAKEGSIPSFYLKSWLEVFRSIQVNAASTWDIQFWLHCLKRRMLSAFPYKNQVRNLGAGSDATHTLTNWYVRDEIETRWDWNEGGKNIDLQYEKWLQNNFYWGRMTFSGFIRSVQIWSEIRRKRLVEKVRQKISG